MKETKNKIGRPSELAESLVKAKEYLLGGWEQYGDLVPSVAGLACYLEKNKTTMYEYAKLNDGVWFFNNSKSYIYRSVFVCYYNTLIKLNNPQILSYQIKIFICIMMGVDINYVIYTM